MDRSADAHGAGPGPGKTQSTSDEAMTPSATRATVIIPAHDEERVIGTTLATLTEGMAPGEFQILVVCNGCTDATAEVARTWSPLVSVIELPEPSKFKALRRGEAEATMTPYIYLDADVLLAAPDLRMLLAALVPGVLAAVPARALDVRDTSWLVRWYYAVWEKLPQVREGGFGRGVIAVSDAGMAHVRAVPEVLSDDLAFAEALAGGTTLVNDAVVQIRIPRTLGALLRRRVRVVTGIAQADLMGLRSSGSKTSVRSLVAIMAGEPLITPKVVLFLAVTLLGRVLARRAVASGDFTTWLRDETSRDLPVRPTGR